jgi:EF-P beta-lysylation protein EpmB
MGHLPLRAVESDDWQVQLREAFRSAEALARHLALDPVALGLSAGAAGEFPVLVPRAFAARMTAGDADDPLLRQVLAVTAEDQSPPDYSEDPVGETGDANPVPGVIHKYRGRLLLTLAGACAVNCRYCFRRHFPYADNRLGREQWQAAVDYIAADSSIHEVILSGGDPLLQRDDALGQLVDALAELPQLTTLRIHTRLPIVIPDRVTEGLLAAIRRPGLHTVMVLHSNHPREIDAAVQRAAGRLREHNVLLLNQAVLLAGVNDAVDTLALLGHRLFDAGILPYYLHQLDRVRGAAHFAVDDARAQALVGELALRVPGYLLPRLVRERAGALSKRELAPDYPA